MREGFLHSIAVFIGLMFVFVMVLFVWKVISFDIATSRNSCREFSNLASKKLHFSEVSFGKVVYTANSRNHRMVFGLSWIKSNSNWTKLETRILKINILQTGYPTPEQQLEKLKN
jgi:hypothetical protein